MRKRLRNDDIACEARDRLKGALSDALEPLSLEHNIHLTHKTPVKTERNYNDYRTPNDKRSHDDMADDYCFSDKSERRSGKKRGVSPARSGSYVMKLFDRSVDLAKFEEDTPLYPICRAWMANRPKQSLLGMVKPMIPLDHDVSLEPSLELPPPEGSLVSRVPSLLPEQQTHCEIDLNFNYDDNPPPSKDNLLKSHMVRWRAIRRKWFEQAVLYESRYNKTQELLNEMETKYEIM